MIQVTTSYAYFFLAARSTDDPAYRTKVDTAYDPDTVPGNWELVKRWPVFNTLSTISSRS